MKIVGKHNLDKRPKSLSNFICVTDATKFTIQEKTKLSVLYSYRELSLHQLFTLSKNYFADWRKTVCPHVRHPKAIQELNKAWKIRCRWSMEFSGRGL